MQMEEQIGRVGVSTGVHMRKRCLEKSKRQNQEGDDADVISQTVHYLWYSINTRGVSTRPKIDRGCRPQSL